MKNTFAYISAGAKNFGITDWLLCITLLLSVSFLKLAPMGLILLLIASVVKRKSAAEIKSALLSFRSVGFWCMCFFIFHVIGMLWSENKAFGWSDVGMKLSFLLVPVIAAVGRFNITLKQLALVTAFGLAALSVYLLGNAMVRSVHDPAGGNGFYFLETQYSALMHRSYWATYTAVAASWLFYLLTGQKVQKLVLLAVPAYLLLVVSTFLTVSKAGIIILLILTFVIIIRLIIVRRYWYLALAGLAGVIALALFFSFSHSRLAGRFQKIPEAFSHVRTTNNPETESNTARIIMWSTAFRVIKHNWLTGTGTGDVKDVLIAKNIQLGNTGVAESKLNAHNQFLNSWVQLGLAGIGFLLMIFVSAFSLARRSGSFLLFILAAGLFLTMLFESFVETQAGIIPFCLLMVFFGQLSSREEREGIAKIN